VEVLAYANASTSWGDKMKITKEAKQGRKNLNYNEKLEKKRDKERQAQMEKAMKKPGSGF